MSVAYEQRAVDALTQIGATTAVMQLDQIAQQAAAGQWSYTHFLGRLLEPEIAARRQRVVETSLRFAGLRNTGSPLCSGKPVATNAKEDAESLRSLVSTSCSKYVTKSRMTGDCHVMFCGHLRGEIPLG